MPGHIHYLYSSLARRVRRHRSPFTPVLAYPLRLWLSSLRLGLHSCLALAQVDRTVEGEGHQGLDDV